MTRPPCFECSRPAEHDHHVVPRFLGGTKTVPLCSECHGKAHHTRTVLWKLAIEGRETKRSQGGYCGGEAPYGWTLTAAGELAPETDEQTTARTARELRVSGLSLRAVGARLEEQGFLARNGRRWHPQTVKVVLAARQAEQKGDKTP